MAVYQGARPRTILLPPRPRLAPAPSLPRRRTRGAIRARRTSSRIGFLLGGIVLAFLLAFFSLAQSVGVSATSYDIDDAAADQARLQAQVRDLESDLNRLGSEPAIRKLAIDAGLGQLAEPLVLRAR